MNEIKKGNLSPHTRAFHTGPKLEAVPYLQVSVSVLKSNLKKKKKIVLFPPLRKDE